MNEDQNTAADEEFSVLTELDDISFPGTDEPTEA